MKKIIQITAIALLFSLSAQAQKLNEVQTGSVLAPVNVKVDAKLTEWGDNFQAYNKATDVYYTMANDDANLYLVIKSVNPTNNNKILGGGINIVINTQGKKKEKDAFVITFPLVDLANLRSQIMQGMRRGGTQPQALDSTAIAGMRKKAISTAKEIKLVGFKDIPDSVISIYNEWGIKALMDFDNKGSLIVEMALPLKYFNLKADKESSFAYQIKLNGIQINAIFPGAAAFMQGGGAGGGFGGGGFGGGGGNFGGGGGGAPMMASGGGIPTGMADIASMLSATDFWGKYTLAKK